MLHNYAQQSPGTFVNDAQVAEVLEMELQAVRDYMDLLESTGDITAANPFGGHAAIPTAQGRMRLRYRS